jgi:hypothetical protein
MTTYYMLTSWPSQVMSEVVKDGGRSPLSYCDETPPATVAKNWNNTLEEKCKE